MKDEPIKILSCGDLENESISGAGENNIHIDIIPYTAIQTFADTSTKEAIQIASKENQTIVFTSKNAVTAVIRSLEQYHPAWNIYCVSGATKDSASVFFGAASIKGTAENALSLAKIIVRDGVNKILFFCGNLRRPELPDYLARQGVPVQELVVYETQVKRQRIDELYDGIIFYSPSAVDQFFIDNQPASSTIFFAIGDTTANAIRKYTNNIIYTSPVAEKKILVKEVIQHFLTTTKKTDPHGASK